MKTAVREKLPASVGMLKFFEHRFHPLQRNVRIATLTDEKDGTAPALLPDLIDAEVLWLDGDYIVIRGQELIDGQFFGQTWDVWVY